VSAAERPVFAVLRLHATVRGRHHPCCNRHHEHKAGARRQ
jgi:hypothetical protein